MQSYKNKVFILADMNRAIFILTFISILLSFGLVAQSDNGRILLTGVVLTGDSLERISNTNIIVINRNRGTASDENGYFSFYINANDTIVFSAIGFKDGQYVVPMELTRSHYSIVQIMSNDTVWLQETIIYPWLSYEDFGDQLITMIPPITDEERAKSNLDDAKMYEKYINIHMDGSANFKYQNKLYQDRMYWSGQAPPMQIFNPFAWADFIKSINNGEYKKKS